MKHKDKRKKRRDPFKLLHWGALFPTVFTAAIGIMLLALTDNNNFAKVAGVLLAVAGALLVGGAFLGGRAGLFQILFGALFIGFAVWLFVDQESGLFMLYYVFASILLVRGIFGMWSSLAAQHTGGNWWKIQLFGALGIAVFAFIAIFDPFASVKAASIFIGLFMLADAVLELCSGIRKLLAKTKEDTPKQEVRQEEAPEQETRKERKEREKQERAQQKAKKE